MEQAKMILALEQRLKRALPGWQAQRVMATHVHQEARLKPPQNSRKAGVLMLLYPGEGRWWVPVIRRSTYRGIHSGQMALPGGKVEAKDTDIIATALRETHEEIGVEVGRNQVLGTLSDIYIPPSNIIVTPVLAVQPVKPAYQPEPNEVAEVVDIQLNDLLDAKNMAVLEVGSGKRAPLHAPAYMIREKIIWGATAMMLSEFLHIVRELD